MNTKPQLIVLTPVRNEAWVLRAFLAATSLWADKIIIADQMSTDGSREIYKEFQLSLSLPLSSHKCELIVIDNDRKEMHQAATRRMLLDKAREVLNGDINAILFALDADEFLSGDFVNTPSWQKILSSKPCTCFCWSWMNMWDRDRYVKCNPYYWGVHVCDALWDGHFPDNFIHEWRLPWPDGVKEPVNIYDFHSLHFARVNKKRQANKERFYQLSTLEKRDESGVNMFRLYNEAERKDTLYAVPDSAYEFYTKNGVNLHQLVDYSDEGEYYLQECRNILSRNDIRKFHKLDIWSQDFCKKMGVESPRMLIDNIMSVYLKITGPYRKSKIVKLLDKIVKRFY